MTFNTGKPVPSTDPRDLYDNAENLDKLVNGADPFYADRLGKLRESWAGMENSFTNAQEGRARAFDLAQTDKESRFQAFLVSSGYVSKGDYAAGVVLAERNEYVAVDAATTGTTAGLYRPGPGATLPLTLTGTWATDKTSLVLLGDDVLRQELANGTANLVDSAVVGYKGRDVESRLGEVIYEKDHGVLRNGVSDDTATLQAAINEAAASRKVLISGPGTCIVTGLSVPSDLEWLCIGSKLLLAPNTDASILVNSDVVGGNANTVIKGLELDGNKANQGAISRPAALFKNCDKFTLERVVAHDAKITSYAVDTYNQILFVDCNDCTVERCESYNSDQGGLGFYGTGGGHRVLFNYVHDCPAGIEGAYQTDSHIFGNKVRNSSVALISWSGPRNIIYKNDVAVSTGGAGIVCGHSGTPAQAADDSYVTDNIIENIYSYGVTAFSSAGVTIQGNKIKRASGNYSHSIFINTGCSDVKVKDNRIVDYFTSAAGACGVFVDGCADAEIKDNTVLGATGGTTGNGIRLFNNCPNSEISGNKVVDTVSTGINISAGSTDVTVGMNKVRSSGGVGISSLGLGAVVSGNLVSATSGAQGILIGADQATVTGNRVTGVTSGSGIFINAVDYNAVVGNILDNCSIGINLPSGSDYNVEAANVMTSTVTTKINIGTTTGNKMAHNIGVATHDV